MERACIYESIAIYHITERRGTNLEHLLGSGGLGQVYVQHLDVGPQVGAAHGHGSVRQNGLETLPGLEGRGLV